MASPLLQNELDGAILKPQFALGITSRGMSSLCYLEGERLLYPVGVHCAMYNCTSKEMKLLPGHDKVRNMTAVTVSPNKKYIACVEDVQDSDAQQVSVYNLATDKMVKALNMDASMTDSYVVKNLGFSENSKLLLTQCGEPDHTLLVWRWFSQKVLITIRLNMVPVASAFSRADSVLLAIVGTHSATLYKLDLDSESAKGLPLLGDIGTELTAMAWLAGNMLAITTTQGSIHLLQESGVVGVLETNAEDKLMAVSARGRGLVAAGSQANFYFFEPPDADAKRAGSTSLMALMRTISAMTPGRGVVCLAVSQGEDQIAGVLSNGEVALLDMAVVREREEKKLDALLGPLHDQDRGAVAFLFGGFSTSPIVGMDAINYPPVLLTASMDRVVRVYNYQSWSCIVSKEMMNDVSCCSLHPAGSMVLVGMHDKLRMFSVAQYELEQTAEFAVKNCNVVRFSNGGNIFACVGRNNIIGIYHAFTHIQLASLKAHVSAVTDLQFSADDNMLVSIGAGGAVYFWSLSTYTRRPDMEFVDKRCMYTSAAFFNSYPGAIVRTRNGRMQHIQDGGVQYEVACKGGTYAPAVLVGDDHILLAANNVGGIMCFPWPIAFPAPKGMAESVVPQEYRLHGCPAARDRDTSPGSGDQQQGDNSFQHYSGICRIVVLPNKGLVFTASCDGTVVVSKASLVIRGQLLESTGDATENLPVYITIQEERLTTLNNKLIELVGTMCTMKVDNEYQVFRQTQDLKEDVARLDAQLVIVRSQLEEKNNELDKEMAEGELKQRDIIKELESAHMGAAEELEDLYEKRLELERLKLKNLAASKDDLQFRLEEQVQRIQEGQRFELEELHLEYSGKLREIELQLKVQGEARTEEEKLFDEYMQQAEVDFDTQTERMTTRLGDHARNFAELEKKLKADNNLLKRANLRLKGDKAIELKKMDKLIRENTIIRDALDDRETTIEKLRNELNERDSVMSESYQDMQMMRRKVQDLEKHKFVLSHKAAEYQASLAPKVEALNRLASESAAHDRELANELKRITELNRSISEKERIIRSMKSEIDTHKQLQHRQNNKLRLFSYDVSQVYQASAEQATGDTNGKSPQQQGLEELYRKYCIDGAAPESSEQVEQEMRRHLHMSELRGTHAKNRLEVERAHADRDQKKFLDQNVQLLSEIQVIQKENKRLTRILQSTQSEMNHLSEKMKMMKFNPSAPAWAHQEAASAEGGAWSQGGSQTMAKPSHRPMSTAGGGGSTRGGGPAQGSATQHVKRWGGARPSTPASANVYSPRQGQLPSGRSQPAGGSSSTAGGTSSTAAQTNIRNPHYRNAGNTVGGTLSRGSPVRLKHELAGIEHERVADMMSQLHTTSRELEAQRQHVSTIRDTLNSQAAALGDEDEEEEDEDRFPGDDEDPENEERHAVFTPGEVAKALKRPFTANPATRVNSTIPEPTLHSSPPRRRPTSAAGVGMRAFVNGNVKQWRENY